MSKLGVIREIHKPWLLHVEAADTYFELATSFLQGKEVNIEANPVTFSLIDDSGYALKSSTIFSVKDNTSTNLSTVFDDAPEGSIAVIPISGAITKYDVCTWFGAKSLGEVVAKAASNKNIKGIILNIDSPGGSSDGSYDLAQEVLTATTQKPVIAYADGLMASAAMRIAAHATYIIAKPGSIVGSIGTMIEFVDNSQALANYGYKRITINASGSPDKNADIKSAIEGDYTPIRQSLLDPLNDMFLNEMRNLRNVKESALTGKVFSPEESIRLNLIDKIGSFKDAINEVNKKQKTMTKFKIGNALKAFFGISDNATEEPELTQAQIDSMDRLAGENIRLTETIEGLNDRMSTLENRNVELEQALQTLTEENVILQSQVEEYGSQPGQMPTSVDNKKDKTKTNQLNISDEAQKLLDRYK